VQGRLTLAKVEALLEAATGLERKEVLGMVGRAAKPLVQRKLEELDVQPGDVAMMSSAIAKAAADKQTLQAVFAAAIPLVQGRLTVAKVEALLVAVGIDRKEALGMVGRAAKPQVRPQDLAKISLAMEQHNVHDDDQVVDYTLRMEGTMGTTEQSPHHISPKKQPTPQRK
jgi:hypothetical protein